MKNKQTMEDKIVVIFIIIVMIFGLAMAILDGETPKNSYDSDPKLQMRIDNADMQTGGW